tara:strand:+ start:99 stop:503 length:405 start_codon:yes stop_codon:yes gene_type:complete
MISGKPLSGSESPRSPRSPRGPEDKVKRIEPRRALIDRDVTLEEVGVTLNEIIKNYSIEEIKHEKNKIIITCQSTNTDISATPLVINLKHTKPIFSDLQLEELEQRFSHISWEKSDSENNKIQYTIFINDSNAR